MNILLLCDEYPPGRHGGIGAAVKLLAHQMVEEGHHVTVAGFYDWSYGGEDQFMDGSIKVYRFRRLLSSSIFKKQDNLAIRIIYRLFTLLGIWQWDIKQSLKKYQDFIESIIQKHSIDIIEMPDYNDYMRFCNSYVPFPKFTVPVVVKMHGCMTYIKEENNEPVAAHVRQMEREVLEQATAVCSVSKYNASKTAQYLGYKKHVEVLYNGIELPDLSDNVVKDPMRVIYTGTLTENKGVYQLMAAWNLVHQQQPDAQLYLYGKGPVQKVAAHLNESARNTVFFQGHVKRSELFAILANAQIAVFPSFAESFSLAPMEAMACKTAVVFTERSSGPELITPGENGILINPYDPVDIADKICYLLSRPDLVIEIAEKGKFTIIDKFNIKKTTKLNLGFYTRVIHNSILQ